MPMFPYSRISGINQSHTFFQGSSQARWCTCNRFGSSLRTNRCWWSPTFKKFQRWAFDNHGVYICDAQGFFVNGEDLWMSDCLIEESHSIPLEEKLEELLQLTY